jgi:NADH-quinone oxidoreductase subunit M
MLFTMASIGLPATSGFVAEFLVLIGTFAASTWLALGMTTGIILGAAYMLWLYRRVIFGVNDDPHVLAMPDLNPRELATLLPIALAVLWMGIYPESFLHPLRAPVAAILARLHHAAAPPQHVVPATHPVVPAKVQAQ